MTARAPLVEEDDPLIWELVVYAVVGTSVIFTATIGYLGAKVLLEQPWAYIRFAGWVVTTALVMIAVGHLTTRVVQFALEMRDGAGGDHR